MRIKRYTDEIPYHESRDHIRSLVAILAQRGDHPLFREALRCIDEENYEKLSSLELNYEEFDVDSAGALRQILSLFNKRTDLPSSSDRKGVALSKFLAAESSCRLTNECFRARARGGFLFHPRVESVLYAAQLKIASILGARPSFERVNPRFGPGATTQVRKSVASARRKLSQVFACSDEMLPIVPRLLAEMPGWVFRTDDPEIESIAAPVEIHTGKLAFVPKSFKVDRCVVVEPALNTMFQLAYGDHIAQRLEKVGQSTRDQSRNSRLAMIGSVSNALATLDLSSASDTIATELVYDLLPLDWAHTLSRMRTSRVRLPDGSVVRQEKFSSMGNGYTFPLETLIFFALASAAAESAGVSREFVSVYGDDIIVPVGCASLLTEVLTSVGFTVNESKSFFDGPFRESCGTDYFLGSDIRPFYLKGSLSVPQLFSMHNFFARKGDEDLRVEVLRWIPDHIRIYGPDGYGDGHLIGVHPRRQKPAHLERGFAGYVFDTYILRSRRDFSLQSGDRVLPSYSIYASPPSPHIWRDDGLPTRKANHLRLRTYHLSLADRPTSVIVAKDGANGATVPGVSGYKRISIYVLG